jgi:hypothetical protein
MGGVVPRVSVGVKSCVGEGLWTKNKATSNQRDVEGLTVRVWPNEQLAGATNSERSYQERAQIRMCAEK